MSLEQIKTMAQCWVRHLYYTAAYDYAKMEAMNKAIEAFNLEEKVND